ncbi:MAG: transcription termination factor NusA [Candidatus Bostrichicola ureolyticus]|nr:MAG: transcription termination factor NusA [Candidatus Bostrichicola ureolyticus]
MDNIALIDSFIDLIKKKKNIDKANLILILKESLRSVLHIKYGNSDNYNIIVNTDKGDIEIWRNRIVVADKMLKNLNREIALSIARKQEFEIGEEVTEKVELKNLGRRAIFFLKKNFLFKINEFYHTNRFNILKKKIGEIVNVEVYHILSKHIIMKDEEQNEMILPKNEQIYSDSFKKGDTVIALVKNISWKDGKPLIILSRTNIKFIEKLFELEIPEIADKIIKIKKVVRVPGEKAKIAVESYDDRIDPVGACVGIKGSRIHSIIRELKNENIDIINYTSNIQLYITRALNPAKISMIKIDEKNKLANVYLKMEEISKAIGRVGLNIRLAIQLTGYKINLLKDFIIN